MNWHPTQEREPLGDAAIQLWTPMDPPVSSEAKQLNKQLVVDHYDLL